MGTSRVRSLLRLAAICSFTVGLFLLVGSGGSSGYGSSCVTAVDYCDDTSSTSAAGIGIFLVILAAPLAAGAVIAGSARRRRVKDSDRTHE